jgi:hypothetical protein
VTDHARAAVLRLRQAFELFEAGERLMRQNLRRRYPDETPEVIEQRLSAWLMIRPGAEHGDAEGTPRELAGRS